MRSAVPILPLVMPRTVHSLLVQVTSNAVVSLRIELGYTPEYCGKNPLSYFQFIREPRPNQLAPVVFYVPDSHVKFSTRRESMKVGLRILNPRPRDQHVTSLSRDNREKARPKIFETEQRRSGYHQHCGAHHSCRGVIIPSRSGGKYPNVDFPVYFSPIVPSRKLWGELATQGRRRA